MRIAGINLPLPLSEAVRACRPHFAAAAVFSSLISILLLAPAIYMLQVYDRVLGTGGKATLLFVTMALAIALLTLAALDSLRNRLLSCWRCAKRTALQYILEPLYSHFWRSLRER